MEISAGMDNVQDINELLQQLRDIVANEPEGYRSSTESRRRRCLRMPILATKRQALKVANELLDDTQQFMYIREGEERADMLREMVATLVEGLQTGASRMLVLLHVIGHYLPQPYACAPATSQARAMGRNYALDMLSSLEEMFESNAAMELGNEAFGVEGILQHISCLSPMATQVMIFLEDGYYDMEDLESEGQADEAHSPLLPPWMMPDQSEAKATTEAVRQSRQCFLEEQDDTPGGTTTEVGGATSSTAPATSLAMTAMTTTMGVEGAATRVVTPSSTTTRARDVSEGAAGRVQRSSPPKKSRKGGPEPADDKDSIRRFLGGGKP